MGELRVRIELDASGAAEAGQRGDVVVVVDVINMATSLEAALDAGAWAVFGASPDCCDAPVYVCPERVGQMAGQMAAQLGTEVILVGEPRVGTEAERLEQMNLALRGVLNTGAEIGGVLPNLGADIVELADLEGKVVLAVTASGGVAFDAAVAAGAPAVTVGTIARTRMNKGVVPAYNSARRAIDLAEQLGGGITVVAASSNAVEDIMGAELIAALILSFRKAFLV